MKRKGKSLVLGVVFSLAVTMVGIAPTGANASVRGGGNKDIVIGFALLSAENPWLNSVYRGAKAQLRKAGVKVVLRDDRLNPDQQVTTIEEFINLDVDAIILAQALIPEGLESVLGRAQDAGIKVFAHEWDFSDLEGPPKPPVDGQVLSDRGGSGRELVQVVEDVVGPNANLFQVGFPLPVRSLDFVHANMNEALEERPGMTLLKRVDNAADTAEGARPLMEAGLAEFDNIDAVVSYNGPTSLGILRALEAAGREDDIIILNTQMDETSAAELGIDVQWELQSVKAGQELAKLAVSAAKGQPRRKWHRTIVVPSIRYDETNIDEWVPWSDLVRDIRK